MEYIGYFLSILVGISLGLIGSGGSILMIPILVYVMNISASISTTYSLFIVGISALIGSYQGHKLGLLDYKIGFYFGLPSVISIYVMRKYLMPLLPDILWKTDFFVLEKDTLIMAVFSILMISASFSMIKIKSISQNKNENINFKMIFLKGILVGVLSGFVGIGGGFLIIPTLLFSAKLEMKKAVSTSLLIISVNALVGFLGSLENVVIHWNFLLFFTLFSVIGILIGMYLSQKISNEKLKPAFGWFIFIIGIFVIVQEIISKNISL